MKALLIGVCLALAATQATAGATNATAQVKSTATPATAVTPTAVTARTFKLVYASAKEVAEKLNTMIGGEVAADGKSRSIATAHEESNSLLVLARPEVVAVCEKFVKDIDIRPRQIYVEARFVALSSTAARNLGLKWDMLRGGVGVRSASVSGGATIQRVPEGISGYTESLTGGRDGSFSSTTAFDPANRANLQGFRADGGYFQGTISSTDMHLLLQAFDEDDDLKTFSNPRILVTSGKEAIVDMTEKIPYVVVSGKRSVSNGSNTLDIDAQVQTLPGGDKMFSSEIYFNFGILLKVEPRVVTNNLINLSISPMIAQHDAKLDVSVIPSFSAKSSNDTAMDIPAMSYPGVSVQRLFTEFTMRSGETAVIGGLSQTEETEVEDGIPYLRDIPWIGKWMFGSTTTKKTQKDILIFVTVEVADPDDVIGAKGAPGGSTRLTEKYPDGVYKAKKLLEGNPEK